MTRRPTTLTIACICAALCACGGDVESQDAGSRDAGSRDAGNRDAGNRDAGSEMGAEDGGSDAGTTEARLTVLSLNLHCLRLDGTPYADHASRFAAIAGAIVGEGVDAVALQELCDDGTTDALAALLAAIEDAGGGRWQGHAVLAHVAWEGTPDEADESVAVIAPRVERPSDLVHRTQDGLRRVAALADVGGVRLASVHLDHRSAEARLSQSREAAVVALAEADPSLGVLVAGDLNTREGTPAHDALLASGFVDASATLPADRIDHVFAHRGAGLRVVEAALLFDTPATRVSDHPGVVVRFAREAAPPLPVTRVVAEHDPGFGSHLWIRGSAVPLDWDRGWPMHALAPGRWSFTSTELTGEVEFKVLVDDRVWQTGPNATVRAGESVTVTPSFP